jgi:hypothetical protein
LLALPDVNGVEIRYAGAGMKPARTINAHMIGWVVPVGLHGLIHDGFDLVPGIGQLQLKSGKLAGCGIGRRLSLICGWLRGNIAHGSKYDEQGNNNPLCQSAKDDTHEKRLLNNMTNGKNKGFYTVSIKTVATDETRAARGFAVSGKLLGALTQDGARCLRTATFACPGLFSVTPFGGFDSMTAPILFRSKLNVTNIAATVFLEPL